MHLRANEDTRGASLYRETPTGWKEVCREPCGMRVDALGTYSVHRDGLRRSAPFVLTEPPGDSASLTVTAPRRWGGLWATGVPAVLMTVAGVAILMDCTSRARDCSDGGGFGLPSANVLAAMTFVMAGSLAAGFITLLTVPPKARVAYPNGERPLDPPDE